MLEFIKKVLRLGPLRLLYEPMHKLYRLYSVPHRRRLLRKRGPEVLADLVHIAQKHSIPVFAAYGTLLGFVREKGFIAHDEDMDFGILPNAMTPQELLRILLERESGFEVRFIYKYRECVSEFKVVYKGIPIDFFFFDRDGEHFLSHLLFYLPGKKYAEPNANTIREVTFAAVNRLKKINVFGIEFPIPENEVEVLESLYGPTWRTPDKKWSDDKRPQIEESDELGYLITLDEAYLLEHKCETRA